MKELTLKIRAMPKEQLKEYNGGRWSEAYQVSDDDFKSWWNCAPNTFISTLINNIKEQRGEL